MFSLSADPKVSNPVLSLLKIAEEDRLVSISEHGQADGNFILTHIFKQLFHQKNKICLLAFHHSLNHYQTIGKKLGYDLSKEIDSKNCLVVDILKELATINFFTKEANPQEFIKRLLNENLDKLIAISDNKVAYLIIDDLSHLLDLNFSLEEAISFSNHCINLCSDNSNLNLIISTHCDLGRNKSETILLNNLRYSSDLDIQIHPLKTGRSTDVTGSIQVQRSDSSKEHFQFKTYDRGVKTFHPGESIYHLYK